jgi:hypothetical protein
VRLLFDRLVVLERCVVQAHLQHYTEPSVDALPTTLTSNTVLPLGPGTLTHNSAGVPIVVVCTKADLIDEGSDLVGAGASGMGAMVKGKGGEWEEQTDGIMQVLRTICLKCKSSIFVRAVIPQLERADGAALFYTTPQPSTLNVLRQYTLHLLFTPLAPSLGVAAGMEPPAPIRNPFVFHHRPNTLDRDRIVVPAGWDSWGKIGVLREGFEARAWGEAWDTDLVDRSETEDAGAASKMYRTLVPDQGAKVSSTSDSACALFISAQSPHRCPHSMPRWRSKRSLQSITTKTRRSQIGIHVVRSVTRRKQRRLVSSDPLGAVASTCRMWRRRSRTWKPVWAVAVR